MRWTSLGHATWLVEAKGLRLLVDPVLGERHHGGVFAVTPERTIEIGALAPDFVIVSHRHTDHFDLPSLHALARLDPDTVAVTSDPLVESACRRLGFRTVHRVDPMHHISLDGVALLTTRSTAPLEWGLMVATSDGVVWNQIDTVHPSVAAVAVTVREAQRAFRRDDPLALALVRWQPLLEIAAQTAGALAFPYAYYRENLEQAAATGARAFVPTAAGARHVPPYEAMDRLVYPVPEARFLRDLSRRLPNVRVFPGAIGDSYVVEGGEVSCARDAHGMVTTIDGPETRVFSPLTIPALVDPNPRGLDGATVRARLDAWIRGVLSPGLAEVRAARGLRLSLDVRLPDGARDEYTLMDGVVERRLAGDWDALVEIAATYLLDVIEGERNWGDVLLGGMVRGATRAYDVDTRGLHARPIGAIFLYHVLPYDESFERWLERALSRLEGGS